MQPYIYTLLGVTAVVIWSLEESFVVFIKEMPPFESLSIILFFSFCSSFVFVLKRQRLPYITSHPGHVWVSYLIRFAVYQFFLLFSVRLIPSAYADSIDALWPVFALVAGLFILREGDATKTIIASVIACFGVLYLLLGGGNISSMSDGSFLGYVCALLGALSIAQYIIVSKSYGKECMEVICVSYGVGFLGALFFGLATEDFAMPSFKSFLALASIGVLTNCIGDTLWDFAIKKGHFSFLNVFSFMGSILSVTVLVLCGYAQASDRLFIAVALICIGSSVTAIDFEKIKMRLKS